MRHEISSFVLYEVTSYTVHPLIVSPTEIAGYAVVNSLHNTVESFCSLHDALDYADNGELSEEALQALAELAPIWDRRFENYLGNPCH